MADFTQEEKELFERVAMQRLQQQMQESSARQAQMAMTHQNIPRSYKPGTPQALFMREGGLSAMPPGLAPLMSFGAATQDVLANIGELANVITPERQRQITESNELIRRLSPAASFAGETVAATVPAMAVGGPAGGLGRLVLGGGRPLVRAATEGAVSGAVTSTPEQRKEGALYGGVTAAAFPLLAGVGSRLTRGIDMTPSARLLTDKGAPLTPGQLNPEGNWAMLEESMQRLPFLGPAVSKARQRGMTGAQSAVAQEAAPPGFKVEPMDDVNKLADQLVSAYNDAYQVGKGFPMRPVIMQTGKDVPLASALRVPANAAADDASIAFADRFLKNELSFIKSKGKKLTSDDLLEVRSNIRKEIRSINSKPSAPFKAAQLLSDAEDRLTDAIQSQLSGDALSAVQSVDSQYRKYKTLEKAINKAADRPEGFTPAEFSRAVRETTGSDMTYATGGGPMREMAQAMSETFPGRQPQTGASLPSTGVAGILGYPSLPLMYADTPMARGVSRIVSGSTRAQRMSREAIDKQVAEFERRFGKLSDAEKQAMASVIRSQLGMYGAETRPMPFATTGGLLD